MSKAMKTLLAFFGGVLAGAGFVSFWVGLSAGDIVQAGNMVLNVYMNRPKILALSIIAMFIGIATLLPSFGPKAVLSEEDD